MSVYAVLAETFKSRLIEQWQTSNLSKAHEMRDSLSSYYSQVVLI